MLSELAEETYSDVQRKEKILRKWLKSPNPSWKNLDDAVKISIVEADWKPADAEMYTFKLIKNLKKDYQRMIDDFKYFSLQEIEVFNNIQKRYNQLILLEEKIHELSKEGIILELNNHEQYRDDFIDLLQQLQKDAFAELQWKAHWISRISAIITTSKLWIQAFISAITSAMSFLHLVISTGIVIAAFLHCLMGLW